MLDREVAFGDPVALQLLLDLVAQLVDAVLVDEHLDPRACAVDAEPLLAVEDPKDRLGDLQVLAVVELDEVIQRRRERGMIDVPPPTSISRAAHLAAIDLLDASAERDVVNAADRTIARRAVEGRLDLARHRLCRRMAHEVAHVRADVRRHVEQLVLRDAGPRVAGHVAHRVAAALAARQAGLAELADRLLDFRQRNVVHLDVLARRDVALVQRHVLLDDVRERLHLLRRDRRRTAASRGSSARPPGAGRRRPA